MKAIAVSIGVALVCAYASLCLLFYQGQWQLVLHPTRNPAPPAWGSQSADHATAQEIRFGPDASGTPQLAGWWLPAAPTGRYRHLTVLYLPSGNGQVASAASRLDDLHALGLNVFAFDYRGFGASATGGHPNQARMTEDATAALTYLETIRAVPLTRTILYGAGVGGSLAVALAQANPAIPVLILDTPEPNLLAVALADPRARILPVRLLFQERFPLFPALATLRTPKLILTRNSAENPVIAGDSTNAAADPKITVALPDATRELLTRSLSRFLDQYAPPTPAPELIPTPAPPAPTHP